MSTLRMAAGGVSIGLMVLGGGEASGQDYPGKPIRVVTTTVGGGSDTNARIIAQAIAGPLGQSLVVANVGSGVIPATTVSKAPPDGYTLLVHTSAVWISQFFQKSLPYDLKELAPISFLARAPDLLVVHPSLPAKTVRELIALAKARPGELNISSSALGSNGYINAEFFKAMAGVNITRIGYANNATETSDQLSGQVQLSFGTAGTVGAHVKSGRLRALAVTSLQPSVLYPGLRTVAEAVPGFQSQSMYGMWAPARTPDAIIKRINQEVVRFLHMQETRQQYLNMELEVVGSAPEEFANVIRADVGRLDKMINVDKVLKSP